MSRFLRAVLGKTTTSTQEPDKTRESVATPLSGASGEHAGGNEHSDDRTTELPTGENLISTEVNEKKDASANVDERNASAAEEGDGKKATEDDESKYLSGWELAPLTFGLCMATFVVALDNTVSVMKRWV